MSTSDGDGDVIKYTTKELLGRLEISLGDKIDNLSLTVDRITTLHETELRDVRHRVANLEAERPLRSRLDGEAEKFRSEIRSDVTRLQAEAARQVTVASLEKEIQTLKTESASQHALDSFKKWFIGVAIAVVGVSATAIVAVVNG